jgi:hypothetical protein
MEQHQLAMEEQQLAILAAIQTNADNGTTRPAIVSDMTVAPLAIAQHINSTQIISSMMTPQDRVVAATLHGTHFDSNSDNNSRSDSGTTSTSIGAGIDDSSSTSADNNAGIGPILDITAYNKFESTVAKLQVHASDIVRVDNQAIGTGGFAKVYKVLLKDNQLCAAKVSATIDTYHALLLRCIHATSWMHCYVNCTLHSVKTAVRLRTCDHLNNVHVHCVTGC